MPIDWQDEDLPDAPSNAFEDEQIYEIDDDWIGDADPKEQVAAMLLWFGARFCDPAEETPYMSSEGGYIWIHGGPYDAAEQLSDRFYPLVSEEVIEKAVEYIESDGTHEWAPTQLTYYDEFFDVEAADNQSEPISRLSDTLDKLQEVLKLAGDDGAREVARKLAFSGVIAALETFLWETMGYWVDEAESTVKKLIERHPVFRNRSVKLGEIYQIFPQLRTEVKAHMQNIVWHRTEQVSPMFKYGLDVSLGFKGFEDSIKKRHDIVHRSGNDVDGNPLVVTETDVNDLVTRVMAFANEVEQKIIAATTSVQEESDSSAFADQL